MPKPKLNGRERIAFRYAPLSSIFVWAGSNIIGLWNPDFRTDSPTEVALA
jgi:hypothetical protein